MTQNKTYIIFDIGEILLRVDGLRPAFTAVAARTNRGDGVPHTPTELQAHYMDRNSHLESYGRGKVDTPTFLQEFQQIAGYMGTDKDLAADFSTFSGLIEKNTHIFETLKADPDFEVGIISDTIPIHIAKLEKDSPEIFAGVSKAAQVFSYQSDVRARKKDEDAKIFFSARTRMNIPPGARVVMIDDLERNASGAQKAGMAFIHTPPGADLATGLHAAGIRIPLTRPGR